MKLPDRNFNLNWKQKSLAGWITGTKVSATPLGRMSSVPPKVAFAIPAELAHRSVLGYR